MFVSRLLIVVCNIKFILIKLEFYYRGGLYSICADGYIGPLCQTCNTLGTKKYSKQGIYQCQPCKTLEESAVELFFLIILISSFYIGIIWYFYE